MQSQVRFNRVPERVPEKVPGGFGAEPGQVQQVPEKVRVRLNRVPKKVPGGFGAEPGQAQQGSEEGSKGCDLCRFRWGRQGDPNCWW